MKSREFLPIAALAIALTAPPLAAALAQPASGPFDGAWVLDVPASPLLAGTAESACPALRLPLHIGGDAVTGLLTRVPSMTGGVVLEAGRGPASAPVSGTVAPDGTVRAHWENYHAAGRLTGDEGQITVQTECGPAIATAVRVSP